jgi:hypothetical protein
MQRLLQAIAPLFNRSMNGALLSATAQDFRHEPKQYRQKPCLLIFEPDVWVWCFGQVGLAG